MPSERKNSALSEEDEKMEAAGMMRWLLTYADMITLLLGLFIVLVSTRVVSEAQYAAIAQQAERVFGGGAAPATNGTPAVLHGLKGVMPYYKPEDKKSKEETGGTRVEVIPGVGTKITMSDKILFDSGSAGLKQPAKEIMDMIYKNYFANSTAKVLINGHTDDRPMSSAVYPSNWELSTGRAGSVARYLIDKYKIPNGRIVTAGYADTSPVAPNDTEEGRAKNRRIEIFILSGEANRVMKQIGDASQKQQDLLPENGF
jgi:chemotaxis protein MotB